jgi:hypothetical protein
MKIVLTAALLALSPLAAFAACYGDHETAMTCAEGFEYDAAKGTCVEVVTG